MRHQAIILILAAIVVVAGVAAAGVVGWMVFQPGPYAFATGTPVELAAYQAAPRPRASLPNSPTLTRRRREPTSPAWRTARPATPPRAECPSPAGAPFVLPFGTIYTPNLTPDPETGIGKWTDADFLNAVHRGVAPDGSHYYPAFPYPSYTLLTDEDVLAIKAYLFSLKPVKQANKPNTFAFPL